MDSDVKKLNPLTSLRFIAAGMIFVRHIGTNFGVPDQFFEAAEQQLSPESGTRDWENRRLLIPLPESVLRALRK